MNWQRILPLVAALAAIGGAIYHVQASSAERPVAPAIASAQAPVVPGSTLPPSDRYANN